MRKRIGCGLAIAAVTWWLGLAQAQVTRIPASGGGSGSGTVNSGTTPQAAYYPSSGTTVGPTPRVEYDGANFGWRYKDSDGDVVAVTGEVVSLFSANGATENLRLQRDALRLQTGGYIQWSQTTAWNGTASVRMRASATNVLDFDTGTAEALATLRFSQWIHEGTDDAFETTVTFADPTQDNAITFPDASGKVVLTSTGAIDHGADVGGLTDNDHPQYPCYGCTSSELTESSNAITVPAGGGTFSVDCGSDAATCNITTINGTAGNSFVLRQENSGRVPTLKASSLNIYGAQDFDLDEAGDRVEGFFAATNTPVLWRTHDASGEGRFTSLKVNCTGANCYDIRTQWIVLDVFPNGTTVTTGDQQACFLVPGVDDCTSNPTWCTAVAPLNLTATGVQLGNNAGTVTGITVQVSRKRLSAPGTKGTVDALTTLLTTDATEYSSADATTAAVINTANDDAKPGDEWCVDVDGVPTGAEGLRWWGKFAP